jgi:N-acetylglucosamine-6-sulfatase
LSDITPCAERFGEVRCRRMQRSRSLIRVIALALLVVPAWGDAAARPNIVLVVVDDLATADVERLPRLQELLFRSGTEFTRFVAPNALCGPSRVSILRGQYSHNTGIENNSRVFARAYRLGLESSTVATWLRDVGYETGLFGKYLNSYGRENGPVRWEHVPPGWTEWYAGIPGLSYGFWLSHDGRLVRYPEDGPHANDVLADLAVGFIERHADGPMFLYVAPGSSHGDAAPAHRHRDALVDAKPPRRPNFDEDDLSDKPAWIQRLARRPGSEQPSQRERVRNRLRSQLSVEDLVASIMRALAERDRLDDTYFIFLSDNGFHYGEHRIKASKATAYDESIVVPAAIRGPGVPRGERIDHLVTTADLAVTIADLAGAATPHFVDGRSLVPLLRRDRPAPEAFRHAVAIERLDPRRKGDGPSPPFFGLRHNRWKYVFYPRTEEAEIYDLDADPFELRSLHAASATRCGGALHAWSRALSRCIGQQCRDLEKGIRGSAGSCVADAQDGLAPSSWSPKILLTDVETSAAAGYAEATARACDALVERPTD